MSQQRDGRLPGGRYTEEEIERGLEALAVCGGSTRRRLVSWLLEG